MHAITQYEFGPADNLRYGTADDPVPAAGQIRIRVAASGVHLIDTTLRQGQAGGAFGVPQLPMIPGREVAGTVELLGPGVDASWLGRQVVAHLGAASGGYAELAVTDVTRVHELPDGLSPQAAVAMIGTGRTTMGILGLTGLRADDVALITSAAGGIGTLLVQAVRNAGATAIGVAGGSAKVAKVLANGADVAVDYTQPDWAGKVRGELAGRAVTVVFDGVGGPVGRAGLDLLGRGGRVLVFGWSSGTPTDYADAGARGVAVEQVLGPRMTGQPGGIRALEERSLAEAAAGRLVPAVHTFPLADAAAAHRALENRGTTGKVVLLP